MTELISDYLIMFYSALLAWCVICAVWWKVSPVLSDVLERRRANRKKHVLRAENIPGTTGYRIKTR